MIEHNIEQYDAIVIGAGISGETCAHRLRIGGMRVALIERDSIGGECAYWAAIPTALLLGPANARWRAQALSGIASPAIASPRSLTTSEILFSSLDEEAQIDAIEKEGGFFIRGDVSFIGRGQVAVSGRTLQAPRIVIATGSDPSIPQIPGLLDSGFWTTREATTVEAIPQSVIILGGEGQAIEIGQMFRLYGANVSIITHRNHLLADEDPAIGELLAQRLTRQGIRIEMSRNVERFGRDEDHACVATLDDTTEVHAQALVVATRRHPRTDGLNLERVGIHPDASGIKIDETCRAAEGIWAIGAVTGIAHMSHMAQYQGRVVADDMLGQPHPAHYLSVPRVYYTDPQIAATGLTTAQAHEKHPEEIVSVAVDLREKRTSPTSSTSALQPERGRLALIADATRQTLVGAWAAATEASEWIEPAVLAIRSEIPLVVLRDTLEQFPPSGEAYISAVDQLIEAIAQRTMPAAKR
jgi:dihydrolipoamide dehydrogenase